MPTTCLRSANVLLSASTDLLKRATPNILHLGSCLWLASTLSSGIFQSSFSEHKVNFVTSRCHLLIDCLHSHHAHENNNLDLIGELRVEDCSLLLKEHRTFEQTASVVESLSIYRPS